MSETEAIADLVKGAAFTPFVHVDKWGREHHSMPTMNSNGIVSFVEKDVTPKGAIKIDPAFIDQAVNIDTAQSLIDYVNRFKTDSTVIFADLDEMAISAAIDYHAAGSASPGLNEHHAVLSLAFSEEWTMWNAVSDRMYEQKAFAKMLDINSDDIADPTAASLLEMVLDLNRTATVSVARKLKRAGSDRGAEGFQRITDGTELPAQFTLAIPVFVGEQPVSIRALTLDEMDNNSGKISLGLQLVRPKIVIQDELTRIAKEIATETGVSVMMGSLPT